MKYIIRTIIAVLCFIVGLFACGVCKDEWFSIQLSHPTKEELSFEDSLRVKVLQAGDTIAYYKLKEVMKEKGSPYKIWFYSIVMAKQYHYFPATYDACSNINYVYNQRIEGKEIDMKTQELISILNHRGDRFEVNHCR